MGTPHKHAAVIKAWADGEEVEIKDISGVWRKVSSNELAPPGFHPNNEYRIKPKVQEIWINIYPKAPGRNTAHDLVYPHHTKEQADAAACWGSMAIPNSMRIACVKVSFVEGEGL